MPLLAPGGLVVASIPNVRHVRVSVPLLLGGRFRYRDEGVLDRTHLRFFTRESALELMGRLPLQVEQVRCGFVGQRSGSARLNRWTFGLLQDLLAVQYLVAARKPSAPG